MANSATTEESIQSIMVFLNQIESALFNDDMKPFSESYVNMALQESEQGGVSEIKRKYKETFDGLSEEIADCVAEIKGLSVHVPNDNRISKMLASCERFEKQIKKLHDTIDNFKTYTIGSFLSDSDFLELCKTGSLQQINEAIQNGANVNAVNNDGVTPLIRVAVNNPNPEVITALINAGADVNARDNDGFSSLMVAADKTPPEVLTVLIKAGADANARNNNGFTPLMRAAHNNPNPEAITVLIKAGADVNARNNNGFTPLMRAARNNPNPEVITVLINARAEIDARDNDGLTPLMWAAGNNPNPEIITPLINAGACVNANADASNDSLMIPLSFAKYNPQNLKMMGALIYSGADVRATDNEGRTVLMEATMLEDEEFNPEIIKILVNAGAEINARTKRGSTARSMEASTRNRPEVIKALIENGAIDTTTEVKGPFVDTEAIEPIQLIQDFLNTIEYTLFNDDMKPLSEDYVNMALQVSKNGDILEGSSSILYEKKRKFKEMFNEQSEGIAICVAKIEELRAYIPDDTRISQMLSKCEKFEKQIKKLHGINDNF